MSSNFLKENPISALAVLGLAAVLAVGGLDSIKTSMATKAAAQQQRSELRQQQQQLEISQEAAKEREAIATARFEGGCILVVASNDPSQLTSLSEGEPVLDAARGSNLPNGSIVCDATGNTGLIQDGVVTDLAFTGNKATVQKAIDGSNARFSAPQQK